jgi:hypothetical protein
MNHNDELRWKRKAAMGCYPRLFLKGTKKIYGKPE